MHPIILEEDDNNGQPCFRVGYIEKDANGDPRWSKREDAGGNPNTMIEVHTNSMETVSFYFTDKTADGYRAFAEPDAYIHVVTTRGKPASLNLNVELGMEHGRKEIHEVELHLNQPCTRPVQDAEIIVEC